MTYGIMVLVVGNEAPEYWLAQEFETRTAAAEWLAAHVRDFDGDGWAETRSGGFIRNDAIAGLFVGQK